MKKRKPPFALASILVVFIAGAFFMSNRMMPKGDEQEQQPVPEQTEKPKAEDPKEVAKKAGDVMRNPAKPGAPPPGSAVDDNFDAVLMPKRVISKPIRGSSETNTQWWPKK